MRTALVPSLRCARARSSALVVGALVALALVAGPSAAAPASGLPDLEEPARTGQRASADAAVVIGVEDYAFLPDVPHARRDAQAFDDFVRYTRGIPDDRVTLLRDARAYEIEGAVKDAGGRVGPGGRVWVYFAGHGAMDPSGSRRVLVGRDASADPSTFALFGVSVDDVRAWATAGGGEAVVVVDACYNGGGRTGEGVLSGGRRMAVPESALPATKEVTEWAATGPNESPSALSAVEHGAFTYFAVGALRGWADGEVDGKRNGSVTGEEANRYVARALRTVRSQVQTPRLASIDAAKLVLAKGVKEVGPSAEALRALRDALGEGASASVAVTSAPASVAANASGGSSGASSGSSGGDMAADIAALKQAKALASAREVKLRELSAAKAAEGASAWRALSGDLSDGSPAAKALVETYVSTWSVAKVWVDDAEGRTERAVAVVEVDAALAWLATAKEAPPVKRAPVVEAGPSPGAGGSDSDRTSPTLGTMKWIPAGAFTMGSPVSELGRDDDEVQHQVTLTRGFYLMEHEVTQGEWQSVMGENRAMFAKCGAGCPVERVSWEDAVDFAKRVSARDGVLYRLPTEAEWEYAARGGRSSVDAGASEAAALGWIDANSNGKTHTVCQKARNAYGLCDMTGNVWEWVSDWYGAYPGGSVSDPAGASSGTGRVFRGGSGNNSAQGARVARRGRGVPTTRFYYLGFRLATAGP